jgi:hypothetical protein
LGGVGSVDDWIIELNIEQKEKNNFNEGLLSRSKYINGITFKNLIMKKLLLIAVLFFASFNLFAQSHVWVNGYYRSNGTYVQGHYRTSPDYTRNNNWSTVGNVNPYTGKYGTLPGDYGRTTSTYKPTTTYYTTTTYRSVPTTNYPSYAITPCYNPYIPPAYVPTTTYSYTIKTRF